jgi:hypothetical protein
VHPEVAASAHVVAFRPIDSNDAPARSADAF